MTGEPFTLTIVNSSRNRTRVSITGDLDEVTSAALDDVWLEFLRPNHCVEFDLAEVTFFNSTAVAALMHGLDRADHTNGTIVIVSASALVRRVLSICGVDHLFGPSAPSPDSPNG